MRMAFRWHTNLEQRLILVFMLIMTILIGSGCLLFYNTASDFFRTNQANSLAVLANAASKLIDAELHDAVYQAKNENSPDYRHLQAILDKFRKSDPNIRYVYSMVQLNEDKAQFVIDAEPCNSENHSALGSDYDLTPQLKAGFTTPTAAKIFEKDKFGTWISGAAPILDKNGKVHGLIGLDISAKSILEQEAVIRNIAVIIFLLSLFTSAIISTWFVRSMILAPIKSFLGILQDVGQGDLSQRLANRTQDEFGQMFTSFNSCIDGFGSIIGTLTGDTVQMAQSSSNLTEVSEQISTDSQMLSERSTSIAASAEEMCASIQSVSVNAEQTSISIDTISQATAEMTTAIYEIATDTEEAHQVTRTAVASIQNASDQVNDLGSSAQEIHAIIEMIVEISEQTKLLALNATIEAARAGEAGKGFAVVASEVKELAKQTNAATENIRAKIDGMQRSTQNTISEIAQISQIINRVDTIIENITSTVEKQAQNTRDISQNISQTAIGIRSMTQSISDVAQASESVAVDISKVSSASQQMAYASNEVNQQAIQLSVMSGNLTQTVNRFKL